MVGLQSPLPDDDASNNPSLYDENMGDGNQEEEEEENESSYNTAMPGYVRKAVAVHQDESEDGFSVADGDDTKEDQKEEEDDEGEEGEEESEDQTAQNKPGFTSSVDEEEEEGEDLNDKDDEDVDEVDEEEDESNYRPNTIEQRKLEKDKNDSRSESSSDYKLNNETFKYKQALKSKQSVYEIRRQGRQPARQNGYRFQKEIRELMFGFGDHPDPEKESMEVLEQYLIEFVGDLCGKALKRSFRSGHTSIQVGDVLNLVKNNPTMYYSVPQKGIIQLQKKKNLKVPGLKK